MKKGITLLVTAAMLLVMVTTSASAASFADTEGENCETAVRVLAGLGIVEGKTEGAYEPDSALTRAEMATIILRTMNMAENASGKDIFTDVSSSHWSYANVTAAYDLGIVNGTSAATFEPDTAVTYEQAVKMVVAALGYTVQAEDAGGYPSGYLAKAAQLDILRGVKSGGNMTRGNMAVLLYNALDVELLQKTSFGPGSYNYENNGKDTLLSYYLKVDLYTGIVSATPTAQITTPTRTLLSDEVMFENNLIFKKGETSVQDMLGIRADFYVKVPNDSDVPVVLAAVPRTNTEIVDIAARDIEADSTTATLTYKDTSGVKHNKNIADAAMVWNGKVKTAWTAADFQLAIGTVRFIDNNNSRYLIVQSFVNYVVDTVVSEDMEIYFMKNNGDMAVKSVVIDPGDRNVVTMLSDETGAPLTADDCARWDIVSIAESEDGAIRNIIRSYTMVKGTVKELSGEEVRLDDTAYPVANPVAVGTLEIGQTAAYYLDFTGAVAAVNTTDDTNFKYGWLVSGATKKGVDGKSQLRIFTEDGEMKVFDLANRALLCGVNYDNNALLDGVNGLFQNGEIYPQLLKYKTNAGDLITDIDIAENKTLKIYSDEDKIGGKFSMDYYLGANRAAVEFNGTKDGGEQVGKSQYNIGGILFSRVKTTSETPVFFIPKDKSQDEKYKVDIMKNYGFDNYNNTNYLAVYDVDEEYNAGVCVVHNYFDREGTAVEIDTYPQYTVGSSALITGVATSLAENGDAVTTLKLYNWSGREETVTVPEGFECLYRAANADFINDPDWYNIKGRPRDETLIKSTGYSNPNSSYYGYEFRPQTMRLDAKDLVPGDVIQYSVTGGELTMASILLRSEYPGKVEMAPTSTTNASSVGNINVTSELNYYIGGMVLMYATVTKNTETGPVLEVNLSDMAGQPNGNTAVRAIPKTGKFVIWDKAKKAMYTTTADKLKTGDEVFSLWKTNTQMMVIVYR